MVSRRAFKSLALAGVASSVMALALTAGPAMAQSADGESGSSVTIPADKIGLVGFTLRNDLEENTSGTLEAVAACGIQNIEFSGPDLSGDTASFQGVPVTEIAEYASELGFNVPSLGVNANHLSDQVDQVIAAAEAVGASYVRISGGPDDGEDAATYYTELAALLNEAGAALSEAGITVAYHNHGHEFEDTGNGMSGYDILLSETDPETVGFELDLYWAAIGDADPVQLIEDNPDRFPLFHVKDAMTMTNTDGSESLTFAPAVGQGFIDFEAIFAQSDVAGVEYYFIENDRPYPNGITSACASLEYLTNTFVAS